VLVVLVNHQRLSIENYSAAIDSNRSLVARRLEKTRLNFMVVIRDCLERFYHRIFPK
jgi:hypothetical protein